MPVAAPGLSASGGLRRAARGCERHFPRREPPPPRVRVPRRRSRAEDGAPPPAVPARHCGREGVGPSLRLPVAAGRRPRASRAAGAGRAFVRLGPALAGQRPDPSSPRGTEPVPVPCPVPAAASRRCFPGKGQHSAGKVSGGFPGGRARAGVRRGKVPSAGSGRWRYRNGSERSEAVQELEYPGFGAAHICRRRALRAGYVQFE